MGSGGWHRFVGSDSLVARAYPVPSPPPLFFITAYYIFSMVCFDLFCYFGLLGSVNVDCRCGPWYGFGFVLGFGLA